MPHFDAAKRSIFARPTLNLATMKAATCLIFLLGAVVPIYAIPSDKNDVMFGFSVHGDSWKQYPMGGANGGLTHIGMYTVPTPELLAKAAANNVTLVAAPGPPPQADWPDAAKRAKWLNSTVADMLSRKLKGVTFDFASNKHSTSCRYEPPNTLCLNTMRFTTPEASIAATARSDAPLQQNATFSTDTEKASSTLLSCEPFTTSHRTNTPDAWPKQATSSSRATHLTGSVDAVPRIRHR